MADDEIIATVPDVVVKGRPVDFVEYDTTAARDAVVAQDLKAGIFCYVKQTGQIQKRNDANTGWDVVASATPLASLDSSGRIPSAQMPFSMSGGDASLLPFLQQRTDVLTLHIDSANGNDGNDGRTAGTAWRTQAHAYDAIPDGASGNVYLQLHGVGPYDEVHARNYRSARQVKIVSLGDRSTPFASFTLGTGTLVTNPDGGTKQCQWEYDVGAYSIPFSNGSHWLELPDGFFVKGMLLDCANCASPKLRVVSTFAIDGLQVTVHPFRTQIEPAHTNDFTHRPQYTAPGLNVTGGNQTVYVTGCICGVHLPPSTQDVNIWACICPLGLTDVSYAPAHQAHVQGEFVAVCDSGNSYFLQPFYSGIFEGGPFNANGIVNVLGRAAFLAGVFRCTNTGNIPIILGAHSGGNPGPGTGVEMDFADFEMPSPGQAAVLLTRGMLRCCNNGAISLHNVGTFLTAERNSWAELNGNIFGATTDICVKATMQSTLEALGAFNGSGPLMHNSAAPGQDFQLGSGAVHAFAGASYPIADPTQFCLALD